MVAEPAPSVSEPAREYVSVIVMMNSDFANGRGPSFGPALVLFDIDKPGPVSAGQLTEMRQIADEIYSLYQRDSASHQDAEMSDFIKHVKNDHFYFPHSRKAVPSALARGRRLYVSDIMLHRERLSPSSAMRKVAMVRVTGESSGTIFHIPWNDSVVPDVAMR
jgi:hypothetical protein